VAGLDGGSALRHGEFYRPHPTTSMESHGKQMTHCRQLIL